MPGGDPTRAVSVKLLSNFATSAELCAAWEKLCRVGNTWGSIEITDRDDADYFCVVNHPRPGDFYEPSRTIVLKMEELASSRPYFPAEWVDLDRDRYLHVFDRRNSLEWHLSKSYSELSAAPVEKSKTLSSVTSSEYRLEGHIKRIQFLRFLEERGVEFDLYGRENRFGLKSYIGALPVHAKDEGILPYRYTIAAESVNVEGYFTEKIVDAILGECLCFYWGCPDLESEIDPDAFIRLDLDDFDLSLGVIEQAIADNEWEKRIDAIRAMKVKILNEMQLMPVLESIIRDQAAATAALVTFEAYGARAALRVAPPELCDEVRAILPPGWVSCPEPDVTARFALTARNGVYQATGRGGPLASTPDINVALAVLDADIRAHIALEAPEHIFVHAAVVAWKDRAIVIPGPSGAGKTTLTAALVAAGATYYSDEFAVLDREGLVHPYARPLSVGSGGPVDVGTEPVPIGLIAIGRYRPDAEWLPQRRAAGHGALALLANTVPARARPGQALVAIGAASADAAVLEGDRGEATATAAAILAAAP